MKWFLNSKNIDEVVEAEDQWEAFDTLRNRDVGDFGIIVTAQRTNVTMDEAIAVRTAALFGRWGEPEVGRAFIERGMELGLPDTSKDDLSLADD